MQSHPTSPFSRTKAHQLDSIHLLLKPISTLALQTLIRLALPFPRLPTPRAPLFQIIPQPLQHELAQATIPRPAHLPHLPPGLKPLGLAPLLDAAQMHVHEMTGPAGEIVQDMGRVDDGAVPAVRLGLEPLEEVAAREQVEVDGDLVEQEHGPGADEAHGELDAAALAVGHGVHAPAQVDVEDGDELVAARGVVVAADRREQRRHVHVRPHDRVQHPLEAEVGHALERGGEGVDARDGDGRGGCEALA